MTAQQVDNGAAGRSATDDSTVIGVAAGRVAPGGKVSDGSAAGNSARNGKMSGEGPHVGQ